MQALSKKASISLKCLEMFQYAKMPKHNVQCHHNCYAGALEEGWGGILYCRHLWRRPDEPEEGARHTGRQSEKHVIIEITSKASLIKLILTLLGDVFWEAPPKHHQLHERLLWRRTHLECFEQVQRIVHHG